MYPNIFLTDPSLEGIDFDNLFMILVKFSIVFSIDCSRVAHEITIFTIQWFFFVHDIFMICQSTLLVCFIAARFTFVFLNALRIQIPVKIF